jgi:hypothetical protein
MKSPVFIRCFAVLRLGAFVRYVERRLCKSTACPHECWVQMDLAWFRMSSAGRE